MGLLDFFSKPVAKTAGTNAANPIQSTDPTAVQNDSFTNVTYPLPKTSVPNSLDASNVKAQPIPDLNVQPATTTPEVPPELQYDPMQSTIKSLPTTQPVLSLEDIQKAQTVSLTPSMPSTDITPIKSESPATTNIQNESNVEDTDPAKPVKLPNIIFYKFTMQTSLIKILTL